MNQCTIPRDTILLRHMMPHMTLACRIWHHRKDNPPKCLCHVVSMDKYHFQLLQYMMSKQRHMQIIDKRKWRKFRPIAGMKSIFSLCYLINYIYKSVFAKWFRYHVITLVVIVPLNNRAVYMYFYTLSVLDMEAGNFLPAVWYVRITAYVKTNSVMFFFYFHYEIVCNCWNKFRKSSTNLWFYAFQIIPKRDKNIEIYINHLTLSVIRQSVFRRFMDLASFLFLV